MLMRRLAGVRGAPLLVVLLAAAAVGLVAWHSGRAAASPSPSSPRLVLPIGRRLAVAVRLPVPFARAVAPA